MTNHSHAIPLQRDRRHHETDAPSWRTFGLSFCFAVIFFLVSEHNILNPSVSALVGSEEDKAETKIEQNEGSIHRKLMLTAFGAIAAITVYAVTPSLSFRPLNFGAFCFTAWVGLCLASTAWSIDPGTTLRRGIAMCLFAWCAFGLVWVLSARELFWLVMLLAAAFIGFSLFKELTGGGFRSGYGGYRFGGVVHPNMQATYCALLTLGGVSLLSTRSSNATPAWIGLTLLVVGFVSLWATGSRTALAVMLAVCGTLPLINASRRVLFVGIYFGSLAMTAGLIFLVAGGSLADLMEFFPRGNDQGATLNGRIPLWESLYEYAESRWLLGHGYEAFWTPEQIEAFRIEQEWSMQSAHSAYMENLLSLGMVGSCLLACAAVVATVKCAVAARATGNVGYVFFFAVLLYAWLQGCMESHATKTLFAGFVNVLAVLLTLFFLRAEQDAEQSFRGGEA